MASEKPKTLEEVKKFNLELLFKNGVSTENNYAGYVLARDPNRKMLLVYGYGAYGVGTMWFPEQYLRTWPRVILIEPDTIPEKDSTGQWGSREFWANPIGFKDELIEGTGRAIGVVLELIERMKTETKQ